MKGRFLAGCSQINLLLFFYKLEENSIDFLRASHVKNKNYRKPANVP